MRSNRTKLLPRGMVAGRTCMSPAEQNAIHMADAIFTALTAPRQQQFYVNCQAHNQPAMHDGKCQHCALDDAELKLIEAFNAQTREQQNSLTGKVVLRAQMWVNVARYDAENQREFEQRESREHYSKMAILWQWLAD